jgi:hypothetical protein
MGDNAGSSSGSGSGSNGRPPLVVAVDLDEVRDLDFDR